MNPTPAHIPQSLRSYLDQFQDEPDKAIEKLGNHLKKRGPDAVGYYLLAWFYHYNDQNELALEAAWKAKIYAPGSPVMEQLHYYLAHPRKFKAWRPPKPAIRRKGLNREEMMSHPISDLDTLINKLSSLESGKIKMDLSDSKGGDPGPDLSEESSKIEDIATETLARIHEKQGNKVAAIDTYKKLMNIHTHKKGYYLKQIERLQVTED